VYQRPKRTHRSFEPKHLKSFVFNLQRWVPPHATTSSSVSTSVSIQDGDKMRSACIFVDASNEATSKAGDGSTAHGATWVCLRRLAAGPADARTSSQPLRKEA
jgi:hypothetical protein